MKSIRLTNRDKHFIKFMSETNLVFTNQQIGNIFYKGGNEKSSYMIANRRLRKLYKYGYIKKIKGKIKVDTAQIFSNETFLKEYGKSL